MSHTFAPKTFSARNVHEKCAHQQQRQQEAQKLQHGCSSSPEKRARPVLRKSNASPQPSFDRSLPTVEPLSPQGEILSAQIHRRAAEERCFRSCSSKIPYADFHSFIGRRTSKLKVSSCSGHPAQAMPGITEVEMSNLVDDHKTSRSLCESIRTCRRLMRGSPQH